MDCLSHATRSHDKKKRIPHFCYRWTWTPKRSRSFAFLFSGWCVYGSRCVVNRARAKFVCWLTFPPNWLLLYVNLSPPSSWRFTGQDPATLQSNKVVASRQAQPMHSTTHRNPRADLPPRRRTVLAPCYGGRLPNSL